MRRLILLGLACVALLLLEQGRTGGADQPAIPPKERIDQQPVLAWPQWTPLIGLDNSGAGFPHNASLAIDRWGITHAVWVHQNAQGQDVVVYANSRWATRKLNGFSKPVVISRAAGQSGPILFAETPWIAAGPNGGVWATWIEAENLTSLSQHQVTDVVAVQIDDSSTFQPGAPFVVAQGSWQDGLAGPNYFEHLVQYDTPSVAIGSQNPTPRISYVRDKLDVPGDGRDHFQVWHYPGAFPPVQVSGDLGGNGVDNLRWTITALEPNDVTHVGWNDADAAGTLYVRHGFGGAGGFTASDPLSNANGQRITLVSHANGVVHGAWTDTLSGVLYYEAWSGSWSARETAPAGTGPFAWIHLDPAGRPVISAGHYLVRRAGHNPLWTDRNGGSPAGAVFSVMDESGHVWQTNGSMYTRMEDPDLGNQDSLVQVGMGPATANVVNGNLHASVPILGSDGVGISTNISLEYNSQDLSRGPLGQGWHHSYDVYVTFNNDGNVIGLGNSSGAIVNFPDGRRVYFFQAFDDPNVYLPAPRFGDFSKLTYRTVNGTKELFLYSKRGVRWQFNANGKLTEIRDLFNNHLDLAYTQGANPDFQLLDHIDDSATLQDAAHRTVHFQYDASERLTEIDGPMVNGYQRKFSLGYTTADRTGQLSSIDFLARRQEGVPHVWAFTYHPAGNLSFPDNRRIATITTPRANNVTQYLYEPIDHRVIGCILPPVQDPTLNGGTVQYKQAIAYEDGNNPPDARIEDQNDIANVPQGSCVPTVRFDPLKCMATEVEYPAVGLEAASTLQRTIPEYRNVTQVIDRNGHQWNYQYYEAGFANNPQASIDYVRDNLKTTQEPGVATVTTLTYHGSRSPAGGDAEWNGGQAPDSPNQVSSKALPGTLNGQARVYQYTYQSGREKTVLRPDGTSVKRVFYGDGRLYTETDGNIHTTTYVYDLAGAPCGLPTTIQPPGGSRPTIRSYDLLGNLATVIWPTGGITSYFRDTLDRVKEVDAPPITTSTDGGTAIPQTITKYDEDNNVTDTTDPEGLQTHQTWDAMGKLLSIEQPTGSGRMEKFRYDGNGNKLLWTDWMGNISQAAFTGMDRVQTVSPPAGVNDKPIGLTSFANGLLRTATQDNAVYTMAYKLNDLPLSQTYPPVQVPFGDPVQQRTDMMVYSDNDDLLASEVMGGAQAGTLVAGVGAVLDIRRRATESWQLTAPTAAALSEPPVYQGKQTTSALDAEGNRTQIKDPSGVKVGATYTQRDQLEITKDGFGQTTSQTGYDDNGNPQATSVPDPVTGSGNLIQAGQTFYDLSNHAKEVDGNLGVRTRYAYNRRGQITTVARRLDDDVNNLHYDVVTTYTYDSPGQSPGRVGWLTDMYQQVGGGLPMNHSRYFYNNNGDRTDTYDPNGNHYQMVFDNLHRMQSVTYPNNDSEAWTYDGKGLELTHQLRDGTVLSSTHDARGRLIEVDSAGPHGGASMFRSMDEADRPHQIVRKLSAGNILTETISYTGPNDPGALGRVYQTSLVYNNGVSNTTLQTINYTYFDNGQRASMTVSNPGGLGMEYAYDSLGHLVRVGRVGDQSFLVSKFYDAGGRLRVEGYPGPQYSVGYDYDRNGRLTDIRGPELSIHYAYDTLDRRVRMEYRNLGVAWNYTYDDLGRLTEEHCFGSGPAPVPPPPPVSAGRGQGNTSDINQTTEVCATPKPSVQVSAYDYKYTYDANGNRTGKHPGPNGGSPIFDDWTYTVDPQSNLVTGATSSSGRNISYSYRDGFKNLTSRVEGNTSESFTYDEQSRLLTYMRSVSGTVVESFQYVYGPQGERIESVDITNAQAVTYLYTFDGQDIVSDQLKIGRIGAGGAATQTSTYANDLAIDRKIARFLPAGQSPPSMYYQNDALGSPHHIVDNTGAVLNSYVTSAWGEDVIRRSPQNVQVADRYSLAGRERDAETAVTDPNTGQTLDPALMNFRAREYDPALGRFLQNDPILGNRATEGYAYAGGNPVTNTDPTGDTLRVTVGPGEFRSQAQADLAIREMEQLTGHVIKMGGGGDLYFTPYAIESISENGSPWFPISSDDVNKFYQMQNDSQEHSFYRLWKSWRTAGVIAEANAESFNKAVAGAAATPPIIAASIVYPRAAAALSIFINSKNTGELAIKAYAENAPLDEVDAQAWKTGVEGVRDLAAGLLMKYGGALLAGESEEGVINISTAGKSPAEIASLREYAQRANAWLAENGPQTIRSTAGRIQRASAAAARAERIRAAEAGTPYQGQAGHVPDTAITGQPNPPGGWLDMAGSSNNAAGGVLGPRVGTRITRFTIDGREP